MRRCALLTNIPASQLDSEYSGSKLIRMGEPEAKAGGHQGNADNGSASAGQRSAVAAKAAAIQAAQSRPLSWKTVLKRGVGLAAAGLAIYLVLPSLTEVLASWPRLSTLAPVWLAVALAAELASFTCNFGLQRLALRARSWFPVVTAGLAGNAVTGILPGGAAAGAAVQFEMLGTAGFDTDTVVGGLTAFSLVNVAALLALPVLTIPAMLGGAVASPGLVHTAFVGAAGFLLVAIAGAVVLRTDRPLAAAGRAAERLSPTGSPPTGSRYSRARPPTCSSASATAPRAIGPLARIMVERRDDGT